MKHLILVGACYLDTVLSVPWYPEEDSKLRATTIRTRRGGNCPNALEVIQQLLLPEDGVKAYLVATLPSKTSPATSSIIASFGDETSVSFQHCLYRQNHTEAASCYIIRSLESGSRTIVNHNDLPEMTTSEFEYIARSFSPDQQTWWHFEVTSHIPEGCPGTAQTRSGSYGHTLRRLLPDSKISVEIEKPGRDGLTDLASAADVVFYSRTWAEVQSSPRPGSNMHEADVLHRRAAVTHLPKIA
ncbi:hypothetical protein S40288_01432 [Stachybotrys chartarum IBT 40288]|nr:hypothetical protein S40288_01432 [Stachybotrys chartarum IBT 40288]